MKKISIKQKNVLRLPTDGSGWIWDFLDMDFRFSDHSDIITDAIDSLIAQDIPIKILNLPFCFVLGYKRYCQHDNSDSLSQIGRCRHCRYGDRCRGADPGYIKKWGKEEIRPVVVTDILSDMEKCLLKVLSAENDISSARVLEIAKGFNICSSCDDGTAVLISGQKLIDRGLVERTKIKGRYFWKLK